MKRFICLLIATLLLVSCMPAPQEAPTPSATTTPLSPTATPTSTPTPQTTVSPAATPALPSTSTVHIEPWESLPGGEDLLQYASWGAFGTLREETLEIESEGSYKTVYNENDVYLNVTGNFGIVATIEAISGDIVYLSLYGALPQGEWWQGVHRLDVGLDPHNTQVAVNYWDGTNTSPKVGESFSINDFSNPAKLQIRRVGTQIVIIVNDSEITRLDIDPFPEGRVYIGANVMPNSKLAIHTLSLEAEPGQAENIELVTETPAIYIPSEIPLRSLAEKRGLLFGSAVDAGHLRGDQAYADAVGHEFNILTPENEMKFEAIHPLPDQYNFAGADAIVAYAQEHDMLVHGHTLVWHQQQPAWVDRWDWTREELMAVLQEHITTVVGRYKGQIAIWDVVNEGLSDNGKMRENIWYMGIGPDYMDLAFQWAHEADPDALLIYNDYEVKEINGKSNGMYELVKGMVERGVPIHGVGFQMHISASNRFYEEGMLNNMQRFADLGLDVHITELDVRVRGDPTPEKLELQAAVYRKVMDLCLTADNCASFTTWGLTDRYSWIPSHNPGYGHALIFDAQYQPKPAYTALQEALTEP